MDSADYSPATGQLLSPIGTVIPLQNGAASDQFFLTFARIGTHSRAYTDAVPVAPPPVDLPPSPDIGVRVFDEVNAAMAKLTTVPATTPAVNSTYLTVQTGLPTIFNMQSVSSGAQIASAQLAMQYCQALVTNPSLAQAFFPGMNFNATPAVAFASTADMDLVVQPLINGLIGQNIATQPTPAAVSSELYSLIGGLAGLLLFIGKPLTTRRVWGIVGWFLFAAFSKEQGLLFVGIDGLSGKLVPCEIGHRVGQ